MDNIINIVEKEPKKKINKKINKLYNIFVYCGGKCGSTTLANTFTKNNYQAIHVHSAIKYQYTFKTTYDIYELINASAQNYKTIYFIDSYRLPIERKISSFFQNIQTHLPNYINFTLTALIKFFNQNMLYGLEEYHSINEVLDHYQLPLFTGFDFEKRYNLVKKNNKVFIKILFKDIGEWTTILSDLFQKPITLYTHNTTSEKPINSLYQDFLHLLTFKTPIILI
jgi:hypothetical protein